MNYVPLWEAMTNQQKDAEIKKCYRLLTKLQNAYRKKNKKKILNLYDEAATINMDGMGEKWTKRYNKAVDKANEVLQFF